MYTATTEIYTLSLHDALPISADTVAPVSSWRRNSGRRTATSGSSTACRRAASIPGSSASSRACGVRSRRSEEHTSELQSRRDLVCRLLLEKKKKKKLVLYKY